MSTRWLEVRIQALGTTLDQFLSGYGKAVIEQRLLATFPSDFQPRVTWLDPGQDVGPTVTDLELGECARTALAGFPSYPCCLLLVGPAYDTAPYRGLMFDGARKACAVFIPPTPSSLDELVYAMAHELGHVLNLDHQDRSRTGGCVMSSPEAYALSFSRVARYHLVNHPEGLVYPGSAFGNCINEPEGSERDRHTWPRDNVVYLRDGEAGVSRTRSLQLRLRPGFKQLRRKQPAFILGEPLYARFTLHNTSKRALRLRAGPQGGAAFELQLERDPGVWESLALRRVACGDPFRLGPGERVVQETKVIYRNSRFVLPTPGAYKVRAAVLLLDGRRLVSVPTTVHVVPTRTRRHRRHAEHVLHPEVGRALEAGSTTHTSIGRRRLEVLVRSAAFRGHPLRGWGKLALAVADALAFLQGSGKPHRALAALTAVMANRTLPQVVRLDALLWATRVREVLGQRDKARRSLRGALTLARDAGIRGSIERRLTSQ